MPKINNEAFKQKQQESNLTQDETCLALGVTYHTLKAVLYGHHSSRYMSMGRIKKFAALYGCDPEDLLLAPADNESAAV